MPNIQQTVSRLTHQTEERLAQQKAAQLNYQYANLEGYPANFEILNLATIDEIEKWQVVPFAGDKNRVRVGVVKPDEPKIRAFLGQLANQKKLQISITVVSESSIKAMVELYKDLLEQQAQHKKEQALKDKEAEKHNYAKLVKTLADLQKYAQLVSTSELFDLVLASAINQNASDIHFEPEEDDYAIRFRIDGVLQSAVNLPAGTIKPLVSRIKMHANLKLDLAEKPQDGRFSMDIGGQAVDFRVSSLPSQYGESIVMRILRQDIQQLDIEQLGFNERDLKLILEAIHKPYGMVVITGPTGSGKTTTLYAILNSLNVQEKKIITLEDPIEYRLKGIEQSQIEASKKYSFADALRAALRQDPDIVMVGEIRDEETARIALNAALTGHLVLTTVHANNSVMAMPRLVDMGIEPFFLSGSINLIIAQRLIRKIDQQKSTNEQVSYEGRTVIGEVLQPSPNYERAVIKKEDFATLLELARETGMQTMIDDGRSKAKAGITTEEEVMRVTQEVDR